MKPTGYIVFAHGSQLEPANEVVRSAARRLSEAAGYEMVDAAFLECAEPTLPAAIDRMVDAGAGRVVVIPFFLMPGRHTSEDLPRIVRDASRIHKNVPIEITESLDGHPLLDRILLERAVQADHESRRKS